MGLVTLSARELDRGEVTTRQIRRLCVAYRKQGPAGLASLKRGRPSNRRLAVALQEQAIAVVRERYRDFGPTLAHEKLVELHDVCVGRETLRKWMLASGLWLPRAVRKAAPHQPRGRRECFGELVQIDGCKHRWFEERGAECA